MKATVITEHPVAFHSPDHQDAAHGGSGNDNSINPPFNKKLAKLYEGKPISVMDLGCAGGGFVKALIDDGHFAVGLEGSDYSKLRRRAEWATIPDNLFTCDITKPFVVAWEGNPPSPPIMFDVVTCWEVMEHISEEELPSLVNNVLCHLKPEGLWIMSISTQPDRKFHRCIKGPEWWLRKFAGMGLEHKEDLRRYFHPDFVRGPIPTPGWAITADDSFHLILKRV